MIDLRRLVADAADAFDPPEAPDFPLLVGNGEGGGNRQVIVNDGISHLSHFSHPENEHLGSFVDQEKNAQIFPDNSRVASVCVSEVGKVGKVGNASQYNGLHFPPPPSLVGKKEEKWEIASAGRPNSLPPEWLDGAASLSRTIEPCPGFRYGHWAAVYDCMLEFLRSDFAAEAARLGWPTDLLFGVHPKVGVANVASCGVLMMTGLGGVTAVSDKAISLGGLVYPRRPHSTPSVPVWSFHR